MRSIAAFKVGIPPFVLFLLMSCSEKEWIFDCRGFCDPVLVVNLSPPIYEDFTLKIKTQNNESIELICPEPEDIFNGNLYSCLNVPGPLNTNAQGFKSIVYSTNAKKIQLEIWTKSKNYAPKDFLLTYEGIDKQICSQDGSVEPCQSAVVEINTAIEDFHE